MEKWKDIELITKYFPDLTEIQKHHYSQLKELYTFWNNQINVISRKDIDLIYEHHVLHSLGIAKVMRFKNGTRILDVGTGGGFPGIPLAIMFPECEFLLVDSIGKKIKVVNEVASALGLKNVSTQHVRAEEIKEKFDFVVSRAVTAFPEFYYWVRNKVLKESFNKKYNGIFYLKGGDLTEELKDFQRKIKLYNLSDYFKEEFFETKKVVYYPVRSDRA
jgi:16S rRNA (guanine527-N7)-methyltransferase